jgi:hypothetical protein
MTERNQLLSEIEAFLLANGMRPTAFGQLSLNDPAFVKRLRAGADVRLETAGKLRSFMEKFTGKPPAKSRRGHNNEFSNGRQRTSAA